MTGYQQNLLDKNPHLVVVSNLDDGDVLVLDNQSASDVFPNWHFGPYVLTKAGYMQDVNYHYRFHHGCDVPVAL